MTIKELNELSEQIEDQLEASGNESGYYDLTAGDYDVDAYVCVNIVGHCESAGVYDEVIVCYEEVESMELSQFDVYLNGDLIKVPTDAIDYICNKLGIKNYV